MVQGGTDEVVCNDHRPSWWSGVDRVGPIGPRWLRELVGHHVGELGEAAVPGVEVEARCDLWKHVVKRVHYALQHMSHHWVHEWTELNVPFNAKISTYLTNAIALPLPRVLLLALSCAATCHLHLLPAVYLKPAVHISCSRSFFQDPCVCGSNSSSVALWCPQHLQCLAIPSPLHLSVWSNQQFHFLLLSCCSTGSSPFVFHSALVDILSGQCIFTILHLLIESKSKDCNIKTEIRKD